MASHVLIQTLTRREDFLRLNRGHKFIAPAFILRALPQPQAPTSLIRVGYTVTKKSGNAVTRNRIKRRFRALMRELLPLYGVAGADYVLIARADAPDSPAHAAFDGLRADLERALTRLQGRLQ